jgi:hypothetical protein
VSVNVDEQFPKWRHPVWCSWLRLLEEATTIYFFRSSNGPVWQRGYRLAAQPSTFFHKTPYISYLIVRFSL